MLVSPTSTSQQVSAGNGHEYHSFYAVTPASRLRRSNATILRLLFELQSLANMVINLKLPNSEPLMDVAFAFLFLCSFCLCVQL